jgi:adenylosuccinate synthase
MDVLDGFQDIKICVGYKLGLETINYLPTSNKQQKSIVPIYEVMKGWDGSIVGIREFNKLPKEAKAYLKRIEELVDCKVILISTSPERSDTIYLKNPFDKD